MHSQRSCHYMTEDTRNDMMDVQTPYFLYFILYSYLYTISWVLKFHISVVNALGGSG
jgi:hypothetical protein